MPGVPRWGAVPGRAGTQTGNIPGGAKGFYGCPCALKQRGTIRHHRAGANRSSLFANAAERKEPKRFYEDQFCSEGFAVTKNCAAARFWTSNLFARLIVTAVF